MDIKEKSDSLISEIAEREKAEEDIKQSELKFRSVFESTNDAVIIGDSEGKIIMWNKGAQDIFGYSSEEILNQSITLLIPEDYREKHTQGMERFIKTQKPSMLGSTAELEGLRKDGSIVTLLISLSYWEADSSIYFSAIIKDITSRKKAEEVLRESEEFNRRIIECSNDCINIMDLEGRLLFMNKGSQKLLEIEDVTTVLNESWLDYWEGIDNQSAIAALTKARNGGIGNFQGYCPTMKGIPKWWDVSIVPITSSSGNVEQLLATSRDITESKNAEEALKISEVRFCKLFEEGLTGNYISTPDGKIISCNPAFATILGFNSPEEVIKQNAAEFYTGKEKREVFLNVLKQNKKLEFFEEQLVRKDGKLIDVVENVIGKFDENGNLVEIKGYIIDNTKRKEAEQRQIVTNKILSILSRSNELQQLVKDILNEIKIFTGFEAIGIRLMEGEDYPYIETNGFPAHFVEMERFLCSKDLSGEIIRDSDGKPCLKCMCGNVISGRTDPSHSFFTKGGSFWSNNTTQLLATTSEKDNQAYTLNGCSGEGYESVALIPLYSTDEIIGSLQFNDKRTDRFNLDMILFFEEIGSTIGIAFKRMQAEKKIIRSEEQFRSLYENATLGIYRITPDGKILLANPALVEMLGYLSFEELTTGDDVLTGYVDSQSRKKFKEIIEKEGIVYGFESEWKKIDGEIIWIRESAKAIKDENGKTLYYEGTVEDISEIKKVELALISAKEKAEEANRLKTGFISAMSHEIRTPLNIILGYNGVLKDLFDDPSNPELSRYFTAIENGSLRLLNTVTQILDISKIEANEFDLRITPLPINSIIESVYYQMKIIANEKKLDIDLKLPQTSVYVLADNYCVNGVLINILNNAIKYSKKGTITIELNTKNNHAICSITDEGIGISDEYQKHLFETFSQERVGYNRPYEGTGLGLALTKRYIDLMNGKIKIESKKGVGTNVSFSLPLASRRGRDENNNVRQLTP